MSIVNGREGYVKAKEAAQFLGITVSTLQDWVAETRAALMKVPFYQDRPNNKRDGRGCPFIFFDIDLNLLKRIII